MPIYKGTHLFLEGLDSIERAQINFERIVLSFNEENDIDYAAFISAQNEGRYKLDYTIFRTGKSLGAVEHGRFYIDKIKAISGINTKIFYLAHDDRLLNSSGDDELENFLNKTQYDTIYFPSYSICKVEDYSSIFDVIESEKILTSTEFFWLTQKRNVSTSMSGMILPLAAHEEILGVMKKAGSGARFEHLLCIAKSVNMVCFNRIVRVLIAQRTGSDADHLTKIQHRVSSLYYALTFLRNHRLHGVREHFYFGFLLMRKILPIIWQILIGQLHFLGTKPTMKS
jgi:hypothetical protein